MVNWAYSKEVLLYPGRKLGLIVLMNIVGTTQTLYTTEALLRGATEVDSLSVPESWYALAKVYTGAHNETFYWVAHCADDRVL